MKKMMSLIKACLTDEMQLFKLKKKNQGRNAKSIVPIILSLFLMLYVAMYSQIIIDALKESNQQSYVLSIFAFITFILTISEGIYKSGSLIFNCKDDELLHSLPIKSSTILFIRIFKFYLFEFIFNLVFLLPAIIVYALQAKVGISYYFVSFFVLLLAPIIPILISSLIGVIANALSSKFKKKNIFQIIFSLAIITVVFIYSMKLSYFGDDSGFVDFILSINKYAMKCCYTSNVFVDLTESFNLLKFFIYILINFALFGLFIILMSKVYYKVNSKLKENVVIKSKKSEYHIENSSVTKALIKKEFNMFINTPVLVVNSIFGIVLYVVGVVFLCIKYDGISNVIVYDNLPFKDIGILLPMIVYTFIVISSLMSSVSSSLISLEGKKINVVKSIPVDSYKIIMAKVYASFLVLIPFLLIGDLIVFIRFRFNIFEILLCLAASVVFPLIAEIIGIIVNLKYPKLDWASEAEVVKQSTSSLVAVLISMFASVLILGINGGITIAIAFFVGERLLIDLAILVLLMIGIGIYLLLFLLVKKRGNKWFSKLNI